MRLYTSGARRMNNQLFAKPGSIWWRPFQFVFSLKEINQFSKKVQWLGGRISNIPPA
jgi:hypothetical protein